MTLVLLLGGARSGKSSLAVRLAREAGGPVTYVATGRPSDEEMAERIARHRAERPAAWTTVEEPLALERTVREAEPDASLVVDCLTLWVANALEAGRDDVEEEALAAAGAAAERAALTVAVSNEVGLGIVPMSPLARSYRDLLGRVNAVWAAAADEAAFVVAGKVLRLTAAESLLHD